MTDTRKVMQQALEALEILTDGYDDNTVGLEIDAIYALREALAQQGEPVAWIRPSGRAMLEAGGYCTVYASEGMSNHSEPLYAGAAPAAQPLTDEQLGKIEEEIWNMDFMDDTERLSNREFVRAIERAHGIGADK